MPIFKKTVSIVDKYDLNTGLKDDFDKPYLFLLVVSGQRDMESGEYQAVKGRHTAYESMMSELGNYDLLRSHVLSGGISFGNETSIYSFLRLCISKYKFATEDELDYINETMMDMYQYNGEELTQEMLNQIFVREMNSQVRG